MQHLMKLNPDPFSAIKRGEKTIELRLNDEKRRRIRVGDEIVFINTESGDALAVRVRALHVFESFAKLYAALPLLACGYTTETVDSADPRDMGRYYSEAEEKKYGVLGIEIERI